MDVDRQMSVEETIDIARKLRIVFSSLFFIVGSALLMYSYANAKIDPVVLLTAFYITLATLVAEKQIKFKLFKKLYESKLFERLAVLLFVPASFLLYNIGYKYNISLSFLNQFSTFLTSMLVGISIGLVLIIVSTIYELTRGDEE